MALPLKMSIAFKTDPSWIPSNHIRGSQLLVTSAPGDPTPASDFHRQLYSHVHTPCRNTCIQKIKNKNKSV